MRNEFGLFLRVAYSSSIKTKKSDEISQLGRYSTFFVKIKQGTFIDAMATFLSIFLDMTHASKFFTSARFECCIIFCENVWTEIYRKFMTRKVTFFGITSYVDSRIIEVSRKRLSNYFLFPSQY